MKLIETDFRKQFFRFYELYDLYIKKDGRRQLTFEDQGHVEDLETFLTGCLSNLSLSFNLDGSSVDWKLLNCPKKFKTMVDFYENKITCQGKLFSEIEQLYLKDRFKNMKIEAFVINPCTKITREELTKFFKI